MLLQCATRWYKYAKTSTWKDMPNEHYTMRDDLQATGVSRQSFGIIALLDLLQI